MLLGTESLQTFGGSGFLTDYPLEQYVRDAKIDTLYEGTTAIQGQDLFFRKIVKDQGRALGHLTAQIEAFVDSEAGNGRLKDERALLATALADTQAIVGHLVEELMAAQGEPDRDLPGRPDHQSSADGPRRPRLRLADAASGRGRAAGAGR